MAESNISENLIKCELLCYIQNYYDKSPKDNIIAAVSTFYVSSEIDAAKAVLAEVMRDILDDTELATLTKRRSGQNKRRSDTEDILLMYERLDKTVTNMPTFVATKLKRLPSSSPSEVDVCALAANVNELQTQMEVMSEAIKNLVKGQTDMVAAVESACGNKATASTTTTDVRSTTVTGATAAVNTELQQQVHPPTKSWAERASSLTTESQDGFQTVSHKRKPRQKPTVKLIGKRATNESVKTVTRRLVCFVGRIQHDTSEEDLADYLADAGITDAKCTRIKPKDGKVFHTAAFRVSCDPCYRDMFYNEESWPVGAELRDWVF